MSKYQPLVRHLDNSRGGRVPMSFKDVEAALGFRLPPSARKHQAWWANTEGSHVHATAWMRSGWRTFNLDLGRERVVFVREPVSEDEVQGGATLRRSNVDSQKDIGAAPAIEVVIARSELNLAVRHLLDRIQEDDGADFKGAVMEALNWAVRDSRRRLFEDFRTRSSGPTGDSVDLIREDRDAR